MSDLRPLSTELSSLSVGLSDDGDGPININPLREIINAQVVVGLIDHATAEPLYNAVVKALKANSSATTVRDDSTAGT